MERRRQSQPQNGGDGLLVKPKRNARKPKLKLLGEYSGSTSILGAKWAAHIHKLS